MKIFPTATLSLSIDEFLPHNPCLSLWASEGIVFVYIQAFFHQEYTRQYGGEGERDGEIKSYLRVEKKGNTIMQMVQVNKASLCVFVRGPIGAHLLLM